MRHITGISCNTVIRAIVLYNVQSSNVAKQVERFSNVALLVLKKCEGLRYRNLGRLKWTSFNWNFLLFRQNQMQI